MFEPNLSCHPSLWSTLMPHKDVFYLPFLFIVYTNDLSQCSSNCKVIKYADDTVVIRLISNNNEDEYRQTIWSYISDWCSENYLNLNVTKTKEILDMCKKQNSKTPVTINDSSVAVVCSYKYLGVIIQNLKWNEHVETQTKKATKECTISDVLRNW